MKSRHLLRIRSIKQHIRFYTNESTAPATHAWMKPATGNHTGIRVFNCSAKRKVPLILPNENYVSWYTCGPTVYDATHLGHASCYVKLDIIQRILREHFNCNLVTAMNITDIDDKIIVKSLETGIDWRQIVKKYELEFWRDMKKLNVNEPNLKIRVSENIPRILTFIENIISKGFAYVGKDQSVYFDVAKFPIYGKLQNVNFDDDSSQQSNDVNVNKFSGVDFALWKAKKSSNEPSWPSPWGEGRPGWHIECSTLASMIFGDTVDFHAGGIDLKFPHHENEEAQSCVFHNTIQWVNYWVHTGNLSIKGQSEKMSKSLKNTLSIDDMLSRYTADEFRMACLLSNYRNSMEYCDEMMINAASTLSKFKSFRQDCQAYLMGKKTGADLDSDQIMENLNYTREQLDSCFREDFDTARAVSVLLDQMSGISRCINSSYPPDIDLTTASCLDTIAAIDNYIFQMLRIFGFTYVNDAHSGQSISDEIEINLNNLLEDILQSRRSIRDRAMAAKSQELFKICDEIRNCLKHHGIEVKDHSNGSTWNFINTTNNTTSTNVKNSNSDIDINTKKSATKTPITSAKRNKSSSETILKK